MGGMWGSGQGGESEAGKTMCGEGISLKPGCTAEGFRVVGAGEMEAVSCSVMPATCHSNVMCMMTCTPDILEGSARQKVAVVGAGTASWYRLLHLNFGRIKSWFKKRDGTGEDHEYGCDKESLGGKSRLNYGRRAHRRAVRQEIKLIAAARREHFYHGDTGKMK